MGDTTKKTRDHYVYGIISSNDLEYIIRPYKKSILNHFINDGGMVYIYSNKVEGNPLQYLESLLKIDIKKYYNEKRLIFICREEYFKNNTINIEKLKGAMEKALGQLRESGIRKSLTYVRIDRIWSSLMEDKLDGYYDYLINLSGKYKNKMVLRYIMDEISPKYICYICNYHNKLFVDGVEDFQTYKPGELIHESMNLLAKYNHTNYYYEKELIRLEYLKNLGELMEGTVHDINNLLLTILGYAQLALTTGAKEDIHNSLKIIQDTSLDGRSIIDRIKQYIGGNRDSSKSLIKLNDIVRGSIEMVEYKFKFNVLEEKRELKLVANLNSHGYIYGNEYELKQSFINIVLNGIDAMGNKGVMTINTYDKEKQIVLEIIDTGSGMDKNTIDNIFEPYYSTKGSKGTGLGLYIAKNVLKDHNASIKVESEEGEGSKFTIYFPMGNPAMKIAENSFEDYNIS